MQPFFSPGQVSVRRPLELVPKCGACGYHKTCRSPKMFDRGTGDVLVVGDFPTHEDDLKGRTFAGAEGSLVAEALRAAGVDPGDVAFANAVACRPPGGKPPDDKHVLFCRPAVLRAVKELSPTVIILMGRPAVRSVIGHLWKEDVGQLSSWVGWRAPAQLCNAWVCPTWSPYEVVASDKPVMWTFFCDHVAAAVKKAKRRPWDKVPDWRGRVHVLKDPNEAAKAVKNVYRAGGPVAFDYETTMLKPDSAKARIVCCSVSDGDRTVAYPWAGAAAEETKKMLASSVPKIASNMKFEDRWSRAVLQTPVNNWLWDTMVAAHALDNRQGITSIKFQSFVRLGQPDYDSHVKPYLESRVSGGNEENRVRDCPLDDLLLYCGLDSLLEHKVAMLQMKEHKKLQEISS